MLVGPYALRGGVKGPTRARVSPLSAGSRTSEMAVREARDEPDPRAAADVVEPEPAAPRAG